MVFRAVGRGRLRPTGRRTAESARLLDLRRDIAWDGLALEDCFHATADRQRVRDEVFRYISGQSLRIDATVFEKCKVKPHVQTPEYFYKLSWFSHFKKVGPAALRGATEAQIVAASIGTKNRRKTIRLAVEDVVNQCIPNKTYSVAFWPAESDPCLQIADYCTWAIQRALEQGDDRSYELIKPQISSLYDYFRFGTQKYY